MKTIIALTTVLAAVFPATILAQPYCSQATYDKKCPIRKRQNFEISKDLAEYYFEAEGKTGNELKAALNAIIKDHHFNTYDCSWIAIDELDEHPDDPNSVVGIYTQVPMPKLNKNGCMINGERNKNEDNWSREHIWSKSHGFNLPKSRAKKYHAYTDLHHLVASDNKTNGNRSYRDFKEGGEQRICREHEGVCCTECRSVGKGKEGEVFSWEPPKAVKGFIARMMMYMDVRYEGDDIGVTGTPDLTLVPRETTNEFSTGAQKERSKFIPAFGDLRDILKWHCENPVTDREIRRNNLTQKWQRNRNPFIDRPEYAKEIWSEYSGIWENGCAWENGKQRPAVSSPSVPPVEPLSSSGPLKTDPSVWINELHYDNIGGDVEEFVEIGCNQEIDLSGYTIDFVNGDSKDRYHKHIIPSGTKCSPPKNFFVYAGRSMQNGPDGIALWNPEDSIVEFISYEGQIEYEFYDITSEDIGVEETSSTPKNESLQKVGEGCQGSDFKWNLKGTFRSSIGELNDGQTLSCDGPSKPDQEEL